jgi:hypothetical protein
MAEFLAALAKVIRECGLIAYGSVVRIVDLQRFNAEFGMNIDGYSLTLRPLGANATTLPPTVENIKFNHICDIYNVKIELYLHLNLCDQEASHF